MKNKITRALVSAFAMLFLNSMVNANTTNVNGSVLYHFNSSKPIPSVNVALIDQSGATIATATTSPNGTYSFANIPYGTYTLNATTNISPGGITMGDGFLMLLHLCNLYPFTPIQELASDLDGDGQVTWNDYSTLVVGWFVQGYPFPVGDWVFEDITFTLNGNKTNVPTMGGSSSGDVNGTFVPTTRTEEIVEVSYINHAITPEFNLDVYAKDITSTSAMGLVIDYPETVNINDVTCQLDDVNLNITENQIRISWVNQTFMSASINPSEPIVVIAGQINKKYNGNDIKFEINSKSHFCDQDGNKINTRFALPLLTTSADYLSASYPNPASESAMISFSLPCDSKTILNVYNQNGQLVNALINKDMAAGQYTINLPVQELTAGVYFYTLNTSGITNISQSKRLIVIH